MDIFGAFHQIWCLPNFSCYMYIVFPWQNISITMLLTEEELHRFQTLLFQDCKQTNKVHTCINLLSSFHPNRAAGLTRMAAPFPNEPCPTQHSQQWNTKQEHHPYLYLTDTEWNNRQVKLLITAELVSYLTILNHTRGYASSFISMV